MAGSGGVYWFVDPSVIGQKLSVSADMLDGKVGEALSKAVDKAVQSMRADIIGAPRIRTGAMFSSVDGSVKINGRGRVQAEYGYINGAPYYTVYQEDGTSRIIPLHALFKASMQMRRDVAENISNVNIWSGFR